MDSPPPEQSLKRAVPKGGVLEGSEERLLLSILKTVIGSVHLKTNRGVWVGKGQDETGASW